MKELGFFNKLFITGRIVFSLLARGLDEKDVFLDLLGNFTFRSPSFLNVDQRLS